MNLPHTNVFAGAYVERVSERRKDAVWQTNALSSAHSLFVPIWGTQSLIQHEPTPTAVLLNRASLPAFSDHNAIFLGEFSGTATFAVGFANDIPAPIGGCGEFTDLRFSGSLLPRHDAGLLAYARAMVWWQDRHKYCGACGAPTKPTSAGHVMTCTNRHCHTDFFPRVDPAIIVLITDGERALLGRQAAWPAGRYSTIAGFMEPGESFEDAVIREVREETNVKVSHLQYHSSQPWPFPSSLMVGFMAKADSTDVKFPDGELEDARWFTPDDIAAGRPLLPPVTSISFSLIAHWYEQHRGQSLHQVPGAQIWPAQR